MTTGIFNCAAIREYAERVRAAPVPMCREQIALIEWLEILDGKETIQVDEEQRLGISTCSNTSVSAALGKFCFAPTAAHTAQ
ncbi:MAG: hypothetical protein ACLSBB_13175 [Ruthenibacterium lactatiformans]